jgi:hypothetical protein
MERGAGMMILQVEDRKEYQLSGYTGVTVVSTLEELKKIDLFKYEKIIMDGKFPKDEYSESDTKSFFDAIGFLPKGKVVVWSDSEKVHVYCHESKIPSYSKIDIPASHFLQKGLAPVPCKKAGKREIFTFQPK